MLGLWWLVGSCHCRPPPLWRALVTSRRTTTTASFTLRTPPLTAAPFSAHRRGGKLETLLEGESHVAAAGDKREVWRRTTGGAPGGADLELSPGTPGGESKNLCPPSAAIHRPNTEPVAPLVASWRTSS